MIKILQLQNLKSSALPTRAAETHKKATIMECFVNSRPQASTEWCLNFWRSEPVRLTPCQS
uniref:Uncharacterized protein n=1 Tax=Romanomermis culicivorax TaxID=13658 RepID=A0A915HXG1_ROMCU